MGEWEGVEARIARRLEARRGELALTVDELAARSGVSRALIARIERHEASPTAALLGRLCEALGISLSRLMAGVDGPESGPPAFLPASQQPLWRDPATGFERRAMSPAGTGSPVEIVHGLLPPGAHIDHPPLRPPYDDQHIVGLEGTITFRSGDEVHALSEGDCLHCRLDRPHSFANHSRRPCAYLVVISRR